MKENNRESAPLRFLYNTAPGRALLKILASRAVSKAAGAFLDSPLSKPLIKSFVKKNNIDLGDYYSDSFSCFNDCFSRKIRDGLRPVPGEPEALICPCDGLLSVYTADGGTVLPVKQSSYTLASLLGDEALAAQYEDGVCLVFRLCVNHYHRYCYIDGGSKGENIFIKGRLHTVRPIATARYPVFTENCREYTVIETENFGKVIQMEVGAMLVGKINNYHGASDVLRGEEKGMFLYGGSTVIVLLEKGRAALRDDISSASSSGTEIPVVMGEVIGTKR